MAEQLYFGLKLYELLTLLAILAGPIAAVAITLFTEARRRRREQQTQTMRMLVSTRHLSGDPAYTTAINMIPIDFNKQSKVMSAWHAYNQVIRYSVAPENATEHDKQVQSRQTRLVFEILTHLGYRISETDIQSTPYAAAGLIERDNLMIRAWQAWPRIADALETQAGPAPPEPAN